MEKKRTHRNKVFQEILATEQTYVDSLTTVINKFLIPLREQNIISEHDFRKLFSYLESIQNLNSTILSNLNERNKTWNDNERIGDIFNKMAPFLKMYSDYCTNYQNAIELLIKLRRENAKFLEFEKEHQLPLPSIESYLIMPVQRIPRYALLLEDFLIHTWEEHVDYASLNEALEKIKNIANSLNAGIKVGDTIARVYDIDLALGGQCPNLILPHRRWIKDAEFTKIESGLRLRNQIRIYLFNDLLVYSQKMISSFKFENQSQLIELFAIPASKDEFKSASKGRNIFKLICKQFTLNVLCKHRNEMIEWVVAINTATKEFIDQQKSDGYADQRKRIAMELKIDQQMLNDIHDRRFSVIDDNQINEEDDGGDANQSNDIDDMTNHNHNNNNKYNNENKNNDNERKYNSARNSVNEISQNSSVLEKVSKLENEKKFINVAPYELPDKKNNPITHEASHYPPINEHSGSINNNNDNKTPPIPPPKPNSMKNSPSINYSSISKETDSLVRQNPPPKDGGCCCSLL